MMKISKLKKSDIGKTVVMSLDNITTETGVISGWNNEYIFVKYKETEVPLATRPEFLEFS